LLAIEDVTERKRVEAALREGEERFREMADALPVAIYTTDAQGLLTYFNPAAVQAAGQTPQPGKAQWCVIWKLFRPDGTPLPQEQCPIAPMLTGGPEIRGEQLIVERPDGMRLYGEVYPTLLRGRPDHGRHCHDCGRHRA
jgi:PAS domain S-box-containing protein